METIKGCRMKNNFFHIATARTEVLKDGTIDIGVSTSFRFGEISEEEAIGSVFKVIKAEFPRMSILNIHASKLDDEELAEIKELILKTRIKK